MSPYILIIASSARMLAQTAQRLGLLPLVIDLFADLDTQAAAIDYQQVSALSISQLSPCLDYFQQHYPVTRLIYGSGFEQHIDSLYYLQARFILLGNTADTFAHIQQKAEFFTVLDSLNIPYPETRFIAPNNSDGWLIKPKQGQGGVGIQYYQPTIATKETHYWQRYQTGSVHSVLFLADGEQFSIVGFNSQWQEQDFLFAGIINDCPLSNINKIKIIHWLKPLVSIFKLRGLNSLDFILHDNKLFILEINARIPASMQLYNDSILLNHIQNTLNNIKQQEYTAYQIIYTQKNVQISNNIVWRKYCVDLPKTGQIFTAGQPVCSIIIHDKDAKKLLSNLKYYQEQIKTIIEI